MDTYLAYVREDIPQPVKSYAESHGEVIDSLGTPTVAAYRDGEVVGMVSTHVDEDAVICGPLIAKSAFIGYRLMLTYERILRKAGCSGYLFNAKLVNQRWIRALTRVKGVSYYDADDTSLWFIKRL
jgi:hypothetical protein